MHACCLRASCQLFLIAAGAAAIRPGLRLDICPEWAAVAFGSTKGCQDLCTLLNANRMSCWAGSIQKTEAAGASGSLAREGWRTIEIIFCWIRKRRFCNAIME
jgi:hypothetical protein